MEYGRATIVDELDSLKLREPGGDAAAVYDRPFGLQLLHNDPNSGEEHYVIRYPAGLRGKLHRHTAAHTIVVLKGRLEANGQTIGPAAYAHFPPGEPMRHQVGGEEACLFVLLFHGPFDVQILGD